jgi:quercetin dioxygenase-like cupin family protein
MNKQQFQQARFALTTSDESVLKSFEGVLPLQMKHSDGTAIPLVVDDTTEHHFGADVIRFPAGKGVGMHQHAGAHILMVTKGTGVLSYYEQEYDMFPGMIYLIQSNVPHAILAKTELVLVSVGNDYQPADSEKRLSVVLTK